MKKILILTLLFIGLNEANALEIVYPKKNPVQINAASTFFIGSAAPDRILKINGTEVKVSSIGAFAQIIPLNIGENVFKLTSGDDVIDFKITRALLTVQNAKSQELIEYPNMIFCVKNDGTPLRMTPIDAGINRISHLQIGTQLIINGEKGSFYRVYLNPNLCGWIAKTDVEQCFGACAVKTIIKGSKTKENKEFCLYEFELNNKVPFSIKEENGLALELFNIDEIESCKTQISMKKLIGYDGYYEENKFTLKVRKLPQVDPKTPLKNIKIAIDAGHGGREFGAIGCCGDKEKDINLAISRELQKELKIRDAKVIMTREADVDLSLKDRVKIAEEEDAAILISLHANAIPDGNDPQKNRGTSVYYYHNQAKPLAQCILDSMTTQLGTQNDRVRQGSLALVRPTSSVSVLIEVAYIINPDDYALLLDKDFQKNCAKAIADGIENYLKN